MTQYDAQNFEAAKILVSGLFILMIINSVYGAYQHTQNNRKNLHQSQFTLPPRGFENSALPPIVPNKKHCKAIASNIQSGIECFKNNEFTKAQSIFKQVKEKAIKNNDLSTIVTVYLYLALIVLEKRQNSDANIKHLFFLKPNFRIEGNKSIPFKYQKIFKGIKAQKRSIGEREIDDISGKAYIRVSACSANCWSKNWQEQERISEVVDLAIDCSLDGSCDYELDCSLEGTCDNDLDCSLQGNCN